MATTNEKRRQEDNGYEHTTNVRNVPRVSQLDAFDLDIELHSLLKEQVTKAFKYLKPRYWSTVEPELDAILRLIILAFSVRSFRATVGQRLLNIKYLSDDVITPDSSPSDKKLMTFVVGIVASHWLKSREDHFVLWLRRWPFFQNLFRATFKWSEVTIRVATLVHSFWFLVEGKHSMILERWLHLRPVAASPQNIRQVSYEYLNRELLWHGFAEFFAFVVPFLNVRRAVNILCRWLPLISSMEPTMPSQRNGDEFLECSICEQAPILAHDIGCSHVFCYYCIASNINSDPNYRCPKCGLQVKLDNPIKSVTFK